MRTAYAGSNIRSSGRRPQGLVSGMGRGRVRGSAGLIRCRTAQCPNKLVSVKQTVEHTVEQMTGRRAAARAVQLTKTYGSGDAAVTALDEVDVELYAGEFTAVMGPSGSGKSTLMHCCAALDNATSGSVFVGDTELTRLKDKELTRLRRDDIGFVFQSFNLVPTLTAEENILLPLSIA